MFLAGRKANELGVPIILDPVGSGATSLRTDTFKKLITELKITVVRGNASEILSISSSQSTTKGVDAVHDVGACLKYRTAIWRVNLDAS